MQTRKIRIKKETYNRLVRKEKPGDSLDDVLSRILDTIDRCEATNRHTLRYRRHKRLCS